MSPPDGSLPTIWRLSLWTSGGGAVMWHGPLMWLDVGVFGVAQEENSEVLMDRSEGYSWGGVTKVTDFESEVWIGLRYSRQNGREYRTPMKTRKSYFWINKKYAYEWFCIPLRLPISNYNNRSSKIYFHRFSLPGERRKKWWIKIRRDEDPQFRSRYPPEWSMHKATSISIPWLAVAYHITNGPCTLPWRWGHLRDN